MEIREICLAHIKEITELFYSIFSKDPWNDKWNEEDLHTYMQELIGNRCSLSLGLYEDGKLIGIALGRTKHWYSGTEFWIDEFGIANDLQTKGIGSVFMTLVYDYIKNKGIKRIMLITERDFPAYYFYKKNGFEELDTQVVFVKE